MSKGTTLRFPYSVSIVNGGALRLTIYNPKIDETVYAGGDDVADITVYKGDYGYDLQFTITDVDGDPINLTGATITFRVAAYDDSELLVNGSCVIVVAADGTCVYTTASGDFDDADDYEAELRIVYGGATPRRFTIQNMNLKVEEILPEILPEVS